jgi:hypothetical protein
MANTAPRSKKAWVLSCGLIVLLNALNYGLQSGLCVDYVPESGAVSSCVSGPALGWPGSFFLALISLVALGYCINRLHRASR